MGQRQSRRSRHTFVPQQRSHACTHRSVSRPAWDLAVKTACDPPWPAEDEDLLVGASLWVCPTCPNYGFSGAWISAGLS